MVLALWLVPLAASAGVSQPLGIMPFGVSRPYGSTNLAWPVVLSGIQNDDPISAVWVSSATPGSPIGVYPLVPIWSDPEGLLTNYTIITNLGSLTVAPVPLLVVAADASRGYGSPNPVFTGTLTGVVNQDHLTARITSAATPTTPPGAYGPGSSFALTPKLVDPGNRAGNYLITLVEGTLLIFTVPTLSILAPINGAVYFTGMDVPAVAELANGGLPIQSARFLFSTNEWMGVTTNGTDFSATLTNIARGAYSVQAVVTNSPGQALLSAPVSFTVVDIQGTPGLVDTNSMEALSPRLYLQDLWITNFTSLPLPGVLVEVAGLSPGMLVYNAIGSSNGLSFLRYDYPTPPGQVLRLRTEFFVPDGVSPTASFVVHLANPLAAFTPLGTLVPVGFLASPCASGAAVIQFQTTAGLTYYVEYSPDLETWTTILPAVSGDGNAIAWRDDGPPKTVSVPGSDGSGPRFYRVLRVPW